ncbi:MAG: rRNA large subunit methyltransferase I, partial [Clostridiales bacterium]|nr:rRNA large subunit methyltransferase I [Clostridiales bacterium]
MKQSREYPVVTVTEKARRFIEDGHVWIYNTEITAVDGKPYENGGGAGFSNGSAVDIVSRKNRYIGTGLWSDRSKIRVRLISDNSNDLIGDEFWRRRVQYAVSYRRNVMRDDFGACRLIFGEADHFPGLTVDL